MARPKGSTNKPKFPVKPPIKAVIAGNKETIAVLRKEIERLKAILERQDAAVAQAKDQVSDLLADVEFYRKQINHFLALVNILAKGQ